ncbi:hypothetical protein GCM10008967_30490 [Bacillus carboniphilus]|uniref:Uncharacterized protein n=1 Tax=Bacillus carboniphilus TaxID=86663 RepID=A0ABP3G755_9BACI
MNNKKILALLVGAVMLFLLIFEVRISGPSTLEEAMDEAGISDIEVLHSELINIHKKDYIVFYKLRDLRGIRVGLANKNEYTGWKWEQNLGDIRRITDLGKEMTYEYVSLPEKDYAVLFGAIANPKINTVTVGYSYDSLQKFSNIIEINDELSVWFTDWRLDDRNISVRAKGKEYFILTEI